MSYRCSAGGSRQGVQLSDLNGGALYIRCGICGCLSEGKLETKSEELERVRKENVRLKKYERIVLTLADQRNCMDDPSKVVEIIEREYRESSAIADENIRLHALLDGVTCAICGRAMVEHEQRCEEG